jgi:colicin import membrane protein
VLLETAQSVYINKIASKVVNNWRYQSAKDDWTAEVYVVQDRNGNVRAVDVRNANVGDSPRAKSFMDSIERAVYKSSPLPYTSDDDIFDREIYILFSVN